LYLKSYAFSDLFSFVTDLDPPTVEALAMTAPRSHAPALKNLFYKHLAGKTSLGVNIPVSLSLLRIDRPSCVVITDLNSRFVASRI
jgi:hypothetical protein